MTITTELKVYNCCSIEVDTVKVSSTCTNFIEIHVPPKAAGGVIELSADQLREFLTRTSPRISTGSRVFDAVASLRSTRHQVSL